MAVSGSRPPYALRFFGTADQGAVKGLFKEGMDFPPWRLCSGSTSIMEIIKSQRSPLIISAAGPQRIELPFLPLSFFPPAK